MATQKDLIDFDEADVADVPPPPISIEGGELPDDPFASLFVEPSPKLTKTMRRRFKAADESIQAVTGDDTTQPRADTGWRRFYEEYLDANPHMAPRITLARQFLFAAAAIFCGLALARLLHTLVSRALQHDAHALKNTTLLSDRLVYVHEGAAGVDFTAPSDPVECSDLRAPMRRDVRRVLEAGDALLSDDVPCVCGPMFGKRVRVAVIRSAADAIAAFNARVTAEPCDGAAHAEYWVIRETAQDSNFPERGTVENVRAQCVAVAYTDRRCAQLTLRLSGPAAYCMQMCADLFDGTDLYARNASATS